MVPVLYITNVTTDVHFPFIYCCCYKNVSCCVVLCGQLCQTVSSCGQPPFQRPSQVISYFHLGLYKFLFQFVIMIFTIKLFLCLLIRCSHFYFCLYLFMGSINKKNIVEFQLQLDDCYDS
jgi:hypothetical protein